MKLRIASSTLLCLAALRAAGAQPTRNDSVSAPIRDVRYDVTFMRGDAEHRSVGVSMTFNTAGTAPVLLSLPAWTPGAYELSNFARWVTDFEAASESGKPLVWDKLDYDTWRVRPAGAKSIHVRFKYRADSLDNANTWAKPDFLLFNGTNLFLYPEGNPLEFASTVSVHTEPEWNVTTGLASGSKPHTYAATNYHDLVDMPFFVGRYDVDSNRISNKWVRYATYPAGSVSAPARSGAWEQLKRVIPVEVAIFGEAPWE